MAKAININYFEKILERGAREGKIPNKTQEARDWYRGQAKAVGRIRNERMVHESMKDRWTSGPKLGHMYMVFYDAKWKEKLPYWDKFPLMFPYEAADGGFYGLNLHYLPLPLRAALMDELYAFASDTNYDEKTKINISYNILKKYSKHRLFEPCVKRYLSTHFRSPFMKIDAKEWDIALFLPVERFQKKTKTQVWADSKKIIAKV